MKKYTASAIALVSLVTALLVTQVVRADEELHAKVVDAIAVFEKTDPALTEYFSDAYGYVVFPNGGVPGFRRGRSR